MAGDYQNGSNNDDASIDELYRFFDQIGTLAK